MNALKAIFRRSRLEDEMDEEMSFHIEEQTRRNLEAGMEPDEAARAARRQFGWKERLQEQARDERGWIQLDIMVRDIRYALRSMRRSPGITAIALTSIALAIGAGTSVFSLINATILRTLPVPDAHELRTIGWTGTDARARSYGGNDWREGNLRVADSVTHPVFLELQSAGQDVAEIFGYDRIREATVSTASESFTADGAIVSDNTFTGLRLTPWIGRFFLPGAESASERMNVVISHTWWSRYWDLDPGVVGQIIGLNGKAFTIIGVLPPGFRGVTPGTEFYVPMVSGSPFLYTDITADWHWYVKLMARIPPDVGDASLMAVLKVAFARAVGDRVTDPGIWIEDGQTGVKHQKAFMRKPLTLMMGAVGLIVLIACANISGLLLAKGADREHELAIRVALGASRSRLIGQMLTETLVLAILGGVVGITIGGWGQLALGRLMLGTEGLRRIDPGLDFMVLAFSVSGILCVGLFSGLVPALRAARVDPMASMKTRGAGSHARPSTGRILVVAQIGLSLALLTGAGLLVRSITNLTHIDTGFDLENRLLVNLNIKGGGLADEQPAAFYEQVITSIKTIPGVQNAALIEFPLLSGSSSSGGVDGLIGNPDDGSWNTKRLTVSEDFFKTMDVAITRGRDLEASDTIDAAKVVVVNEAFVREFLPDVNPLGFSFRVWNAEWVIVGVCQNIKYNNIKEAVRPTTYFPYRQRFYDRYATKHLRRVSIAAVTSTAPLTLSAAVRKMVSNIDPTVAISKITTQQDVRDQGLQRERMLATLGTGLALLGFLLSCMGIYGLMTHNVSRRTSEFGIRIALGAGTADVVGPILRESLLLSAAGIGVGLPIVWVSNRVLRSLLYGVEPGDPVTLFSMVFTLVAVSLMAAWIPARRASRVDPIVALRAE